MVASQPRSQAVSVRTGHALELHAPEDEDVHALLAGAPDAEHLELPGAAPSRLSLVEYPTVVQIP
jgi:hypothetical protein